LDRSFNNIPDSTSFHPGYLFYLYIAGCVSRKGAENAEICMWFYQLSACCCAPGTFTFEHINNTGACMCWNDFALIQFSFGNMPENYTHRT
jgi:hypothetical protein